MICHIHQYHYIENVKNQLFSLPYYNSTWPETQADEVYNHASFVDAYEMEDKTIALYSYSDYYIEAHYDREGNEIVKYVAISIDEAIKKYV